MRMKLPTKAANALAYEEEILPGGLALRLLSMPEYRGVHAIYATAFGSINRHFQQAGKDVLLPAGVAHFLEHKMFENKDGVDAFSLYGQTGASANAYTSFDRTSFIFTATEQLDKNLDILLSFVSQPYFTPETVAKEQGIIGQEIKMYEDYAELRCVFTLFECLYQNHPIRDEIVGSVESIATITPELLYACTDAYYTPANMALCAAGNITMDQLRGAVERAGISNVKAPEVKNIFPQEPPEVGTKRKDLYMPVALPVFGIGFKEAPVEGNSLATEVMCDLITEMLCGETSALYRRLYDEGLVQPGFGGEYGCHEGCLHFLFTGESAEPEKVREELLKEIERQRREGIDPEHFEACRRMMYGEAIAELESVERVASLLSSSYFRKRTPAQEIAALAAVTVEEVDELLGRVLQEDRSALVVVWPDDKK